MLHLDLILVQASGSDAAKPQPSFLMWKRVFRNLPWRDFLTQSHIFWRILMQTSMGRVTACVRPLLLMLLALFIMLAVATPVAFAQAQPAPQQQPGSITAPQPGAITDQRVANPPGNAPSHEAGGEANLKLPDMSRVSFFEGAIDGYKLLSIGLIFCALGGIFGLVIYMQLKNLPVHRAMREISELIYETCKTYLITQGKFILILEAFIAVVIILYFGLLLHFDAVKVIIILAFSLVGIAGSYGVAWFGIRVNTFANSRTAFASLEGKPFPLYAIPLKAGMSIGMMLISVELLIMLCILLFIPGSYAGPCFIGFAIGESLGAAALRIAGGIFTKIADIGSDLMKIVFKIKEDDARNPGVIADCTGDNAGDSVGPSADGFETYGVTGVALIVFIMLAITPAFLPGGVSTKTANPEVLAAAEAQAVPVQVKLLVWIFVMRVLMVVT